MTFILAYIGPGAGIGLLSALFGLCGSMLFSIGLILMHSLRRLFRRGRVESQGPVGADQ